MYSYAELQEAVTGMQAKCIKVCEDKREQALDKLGLIPPVAYWNGRGKCANEIWEEIKELKIEN